MMSPSAQGHTLSDTTLRAYAQDYPSALADVEALLACGSPPAAVASGLRHILRDRLSLDLGHDPAGTAALLAWLARHRPGPFTAAVAALTGRPVTCDVIPDTEREHPLGGGQAVTLAVRCEEDLRAWSRDAVMMAGRTVVAAVSLTVVPSRIGGRDGDTFRRIKKGEPCGAVLPGLVRAARHADVGWPADPAMGSRAALSWAGRGFGFAREQVTAGFIRELTGCKRRVYGLSR